jgi:hypothetical protein
VMGSNTRSCSYGSRFGEFRMKGARESVSRNRLPWLSFS